jgi:hypothetical protein
VAVKEYQNAFYFHISDTGGDDGADGDDLLIAAPAEPKTPGELEKQKRATYVG